jgi:alkaline phosphatase D
MKIDRRKALALLGMGAASPALAAQSPVKGAAKVSFEHGVASGDPLSDRVILWTRVSTSAAAKASVKWEIASDSDFKSVVAKGLAVADPARDHTIKIDAAGLQPNTRYYYRFICNDSISPVGRTQTLPVGTVSDVVMAVTSCSLYPAGFFNAYKAIAALERADVILHLGDYIYEYGAAPSDYGMTIGAKIGRAPVPAHEIITLSDYRARHGLYKTDPDLQAAHARAPWIVVWDDHETANDSWTGGAENHQPKTEGKWAARKAAAIKAYFEWMPIREPEHGHSAEAVNRTFSFGDLAKLIMTETRLTARDQQLTFEHDLLVAGPDGKPVPDLDQFKTKLNNPSRQLIGPAQEAWLSKELASSISAGQAWQVLGNQVVMARVKGPDLKAIMGAQGWAAALGQLPEAYRERAAVAGALFSLDVPHNLDSWDGYPAARERVYDAFKAAKAHPIVLSGDTHAFWVNELYDASGKARVAAEFGTTSITSPGYGDQLPGAPLDRGFQERNPEVLFNDQAAKGFLLLTLTKTEARADLITVSTVTSQTFETKTLNSWTVRPAQGGGVGPILPA